MSKSPLLLSVNFIPKDEVPVIAGCFADREVIDWEHGKKPGTLDGVEYAIAWNSEPELFSRMPDLKVIFSAGAGVDKILANPSLPADVPVVRFVDNSLTTRMSEWVCLQCLMHLRQQRQYDALQRGHCWKELPQPEAKDVQVGIMGMGVLGQDAARKLAVLGFNVVGWSRTKKTIDDIVCYDATETDAFLAQCQYLVGLLPLTAETTGIFNRSLFQKLAKHPVLASPVFINAGRGASQNEADLVSCLADGTLGGASVDVFETEPLPQDSPLWEFGNLILTPHMAATSEIIELGRSVARQIGRFEAGHPLEHVVDRSLGY